MKYDCPAPDCDYTGASEESVRGHWGGSQDSQHSGKYHQAKEAYEEAVATSREEGAEGDSKASEGGEKAGEHTGAREAAQSASDGGHPSGDVPPADTSKAQQQASESHELPCGHETVTADELPEPPFEVVATCDQCGRSYRVSSE